MKLTDRVVLVTGASGGVGAAIGRACASEGGIVVAHYYRNEDSARSLIEAVGAGMTVQADLTRPDAVDRMMTQVYERYGRVDILVNNAAPSHVFDPESRPALEAVDWEDMQTQIDGNLKAVFLCCRAALPQMKARRFGRIVSVLTNLVFNPEVVYHAYTTAKSSLLGFSRTLAAEAGPWGITVNMVAPGLIPDTGMSRHHTPETLNEVARRTPLRRTGTPEDVAGAVVFLAASSFITGVCLVVDGGLTMR
jgi:3-oxoacyl-[acyl-carrier protein] reductase